MWRSLLYTGILFAQQTDYSKIPQLQTTATYTTEVAPDKISLSINLSEGDSKGKLSIEELERRMKQVLTNNQVDIQKQLKLADLSSNFQGYLLRKKDIQKSKRYILVVNSAGLASSVLQGFEAAGISNVQLLKAEYKEMEQLKIELKGKAIEKARRQAEEMIKPLNQKLGPAIFIADKEVNSSRMRGSNMAINSLMNQESTVAFEGIDFKSIRVVVAVVVYFRLDWPSIGLSHFCLRTNSMNYSGITL